MTLLQQELIDHGNIHTDMADDAYLDSLECDMLIEMPTYNIEFRLYITRDVIALYQTHLDPEEIHHKNEIIIITDVVAICDNNIEVRVFNFDIEQLIKDKLVK